MTLAGTIPRRLVIVLPALLAPLANKFPQKQRDYNERTTSQQICIRVSEAGMNGTTHSPVFKQTTSYDSRWGRLVNVSLGSRSLSVSFSVDPVARLSA